FRDLKTQYTYLKTDIDKAISEVCASSAFISGPSVAKLEQELADYVGVKHCVTCANGTDALSLAMMAWGFGPGDAVFVPDFTFFSTGEIVSHCGATPVFVDVCRDTFNMDAASLENAIEAVLKEDKLNPVCVIPVDLFGQSADYDAILPIAEKYGLKVLEDGAQGFGGSIKGRKNCSFGEISTTSFFPAKPLGCYGDGGAVFTDDDELAALLKSLRIHGKGSDKYDNVRVGLNSRLDTVQAAILSIKLKAFADYELSDVNKAALAYSRLFTELMGESLGDKVIIPTVKDGFESSWAQYTIILKDKATRDGLQAHLKENGVPSMIYYIKPMHKQGAFEGTKTVYTDLSNTEYLCDRVLSLPIHPYIKEYDQKAVCTLIKNYLA
ncbi:MAG: DegT/DnrJ/EryC1/StrS family aminotransferase, partial [Pseudobutyrivibrio sp.]|nr:DegT/DnrJ/EryC1/StrS family aminotransferase [Pseudobutyrivibrio sp.]MCF0187707.1 DegT/DnrJ/EryC1/StrS family aminotransferase [Bacteroidaceae bacterium]